MQTRRRGASTAVLQAARLISVAALSVLPAAGCDRPESTPAASAPDRVTTVYTTFYPMTYLARRIGGDKVRVVCPCPAEADPAHWMPDDATIQEYQQADLIVINGASFEKWIENVTLPPARVVDTTAAFAGELIRLPEAVTHSHGPSGLHSHEGIDGHTWLDPVNAKHQAAAIKEALRRLRPQDKDTFEGNFAALAGDLGALDARFRAVTAKLGERLLLCAHPAYHYVARRYGWHLKNVHLEPLVVPDDEDLVRLEAIVTKEHAKHLLWESEPLQDTTDLLRDRFGIVGIVISPCESLDSDVREGGEDYLSVMSRNVDRLEIALGT